MDNATVRLILLLLAAYLIGAVNPSYVIGKIKGYDVIREGSGNAGASNTFLLGGKMLGVIAALLDIFKTWLCWKLTAHFVPEYDFSGIAAAVACTFGHMYSPFLHFRGGKGLACLGGLILAYNPAVFPAAFLLAAVIAFTANYICVAACLMWVIFPAFYFLAERSIVCTLILVLPVGFVFCKHAENFRRIRSGTEARMSALFNRKKEIDRIRPEDTQNRSH